MKKLFKIMAVVLAIGLILAVNAVPAFAATTPVAGGETSFKKYLAVESGSKVPNKTFDFSIAAGEAVPATSTSMAVLAGIGTPTISDPVFANSNTTTPVSEAPAEEAALNAVASELTGMDYAKQTVTVDFSGISFPEPGIYRYDVSEAAQTAPYSIVGGDTKYLDVYVINDPDNAGALKVDSYILHADAAAPELNTTGGTAGGELDDKTDGFVNKYETVDLGFSKRITGNQAAKDKYFKFTVQLTENTVLVGDADEFTVEIDGAEDSPAATAATNPEYTTMNNLTSVTGAQLKAGVDFYLTDGQYILIKDLPKGITYSVTEAEEDYVKTANNDVQGDGTYDDASSGTLNEDTFVGYTNTREGIIPTGVILTVAPFMIGLLVFGAVIMFVISRRRRAAY